MKKLLLILCLFGVTISYAQKRIGISKMDTHNSTVFVLSYIDTTWRSRDTTYSASKDGKEGYRTIRVTFDTPEHEHYQMLATYTFESTINYWKFKSVEIKPEVLNSWSNTIQFRNPNFNIAPYISQ